MLYLSFPRDFVSAELIGIFDSYFNVVFLAPAFSFIIWNFTHTLIIFICFQLKILMNYNECIKIWMILSRDKVIRLNSLRKFDLFLFVLNHKRFHQSSLIVRYLSLLQDILSYVWILKFLRILRVTSPLLIILANIEGSHCVLTTLQFIRDNGLLNWMRVGNVGATYNLLGIWGISIHPN